MLLSHQVTWGYSLSKGCEMFFFFFFFKQSQGQNIINTKEESWNSFIPPKAQITILTENTNRLPYKWKP